METTTTQQSTARSSLLEFSYAEWLSYKKSSDYPPDCPVNHFGAVQLEPILAFVKGRKVHVRLTGTAWDQIVRTVTWKDIDREGLDCEPGIITLASGHVPCYQWVKRHVVSCQTRNYWLHFLSWYSISLHQELQAEVHAAENAVLDAEAAEERAARREAAKIEAQRLADLDANNPVKLFYSGKTTRRDARILRGY